LGGGPWEVKRQGRRSGGHYPGIGPSGRATKNDEKYTYFIYILIIIIIINVNLYSALSF